MPTINQTNRIDITVEKFLQACSKTELQEIDLLLSGYINQPKKENFKDSLAQLHQDVRELVLPADYEDLKAYLYKIKPLNRKAFIMLLKMGFIPSAALAALEVIDRICTKSVLTPLDCVNLIRDFDGLENLRKISLVKKPQLITKNEGHE